MEILKIDNNKHNKFLRKKVSDFDFSDYNKDELRILLNKMRDVMHSVEGVGLAANQVGIDARFFIAEFDGKFYAIFNPEIIKTSKTIESLEEGCLSVPGKYDAVERSAEVTIKGLDRNKKRVKMRVWGHLARIFQHEVDHLNGKLFIDYIKR